MLMMHGLGPMMLMKRAMMQMTRALSLHLDTSELPAVRKHAHDALFGATVVHNARH